MKGEYDEKASLNILLLFLGMIMDVAPLIVLFLTTYIPWLTTALPNLLMP